MVQKKVRVNKEISTAIRLTMPSELWRKFRAGCLYMDKDVNSELHKLVENWVKEWHKRIPRPDLSRGEQGTEQHITGNNPFSTQGD